MRTILLTALYSLICIISFSQDYSGAWSGILKVQGTELTIVFNITETEDGYQASMDSPDQGAFGIPAKSCSIEGETLSISLPDLMIAYKGTVNKDGNFDGSFQQGGLSFPLILSKSTGVTEDVIRQQEPKEPYPYIAEEVIFENKEANIKLAGTLTLPEAEGPFPAVVLVSGSGPQNRDEELLGHKPFKVLADHLTRQGIAVLRYDDRGTAESTGNFAEADTYDLATDAESAVKFLQNRQEIDQDNIGIVGHSEGGLIAPIIASRNKDIAFIVLLAGSSLRGDQLLLLQKYTIETQQGIPEQAATYNRDLFAGAYEIVLNKELEKEVLADSITSYFISKLGNMIPENQLNTIVNQLTSPWIITFMGLDPAIYLSQVDCPTLALFGEKDLQVPSTGNMEVLQSIADKSNNKQIKLMELKNHNHLFQECETGLISEYEQIEQTMSPLTLETISDWIKEQGK